MGVSTQQGVTAALTASVGSAGVAGIVGSPELPAGAGAPSLAATGAVGAVTVSGGANTTLTGLAATGAIGSTTQSGNANHTLTGLSATGAVGTVTVTTEDIFLFSDYGGVPAANRATLLTALENAFIDIKANGGGTLVIGAGTFNFGNQGSGTAFSVSDLENTTIDGTGATFTINTTVTETPLFLNFHNPSNVTIDGLSFSDTGTDLSVNWQGIVCIDVTADTTCSGFTTTNCSADSVVTFFRSYSAPLFSGANISATISDAYYGVNANYGCWFSECDLVCTDVRRAFLGYGAHHWDVTVDNTGTVGALGSNGAVDFVPTDVYNVHDNTLVFTARGRNNWGAYMHFFEQYDGTPYTRNIDATVNLVNVVADTPVNMFRFTHYDGVDVLATTTRERSNITLRGTVTGSFPGNGSVVINEVTTSSNGANDIKIASSLNSYLSYPSLSSYFAPEFGKRLTTGLAGTGAIGSVTTPSSLLLDSITTAAAYSTRKLRTAYSGSAIRVRRSNDNAEQDIGFSNNNLDESALSTFVGANSAFVVTWYDQSGNSRNMTNATAAQQPRIVNAGTIDKVNTRPVIRTDGTNDSLSTASFTLSQPYSQASVTNVLAHTTGSYASIIANSSTTDTAILWWLADSFAAHAGLDDYIVGSATIPSQQTILVVHNGASTITKYNSNSESTINIGTDGLNGRRIGFNIGNTDGVSANYGELILSSGSWSSGTRNTIAADLKAYWGTP